MADRKAAAPPATLERIIEQVKTAAADRRALHIIGGGSKAFLAASQSGRPLRLDEHCGVVSYEPTELVITAKAGTRLDVIDEALAERGQMLGFEPPHCSDASTIGGVVACGLSGPGRPYRGSVRDFVLGVELINGRGEVLNFGGQVIKNVAGYDISRLVTGAYGVLGVITQVSLRVLPRPARESTLLWKLSAAEARRRMLELARQPWPMSAMAASDETLRLRVAGSDEAIDDAVSRLAPDSCQDDDPFWTELRDFAAPALQPDATRSLWRLSLPPAAPDPPATVAISDWGGAQRWLKMADGEAVVRDHCAAHGGHATCMRRAAAESAAVFTAPAAGLQALMSRVRQAFDPDAIFNPRHYFEWM